VALCATLAIAIYGVYAYLQTAIEAYPDVTNVQVGIIARPLAWLRKRWSARSPSRWSVSSTARRV
jgi:hypothetical protein